MKIVNIHEAKTHLSRLLEQVVDGESFVIARAGKPIAKVVPIQAPTQPRRFGFMKGQIIVPEDFDTMFADEITADFEGGNR